MSPECLQPVNAHTYFYHHYHHHYITVSPLLTITVSRHSSHASAFIIRIIDVTPLLFSNEGSPFDSGWRSHHPRLNNCSGRGVCLRVCVSACMFYVLTKQLPITTGSSNLLPCPGSKIPSEKERNRYQCTARKKERERERENDHYTRHMTLANQT